ncbi:arsenate reductase/protein-tyrosine-phosphatase family protein [Planobispora takensis]|uniref:ArsR family transcriptional regulator n=1 Tax=Planobispora takensis TaxID=1367882 RepID=A0A8J3T7T4_9ACTN|nr:ArsR family transcriptional regulator [Planobispora takensis]GII05688.1 ArsR family transcriptional regulator [Planobispora takensis]
MASPAHAAPAFLRLAAHPLRWRLMSELAAGDYRVRELVELIGQPQNLLSYHLRLLRDGGLVTMRRSTFDARDSYYRLDLDRCARALAATGAALHPALHSILTAAGPVPPPAPASAHRPAVLFTCTGNSARSPIAEALLRHRAGGHVEVTSAGSHPRPHLHLDAARALREGYGIDLRDWRPRHLDSTAGRRFDYVISLCDKVREACSGIGGHPRRIHWSVPDPAAEKAGYPAFVRTAAEIDTRIGHLIPVLTSQEASS